MHGLTAVCEFAEHISYLACSIKLSLTGVTVLLSCILLYRCDNGRYWPVFGEGHCSEGGLLEWRCLQLAQHNFVQFSCHSSVLGGGSPNSSPLGDAE